MKKLSKLNYTKFQIQDYIKSKVITTKQKQLIFSIRTNTYKVKGNLPKLYKNNLKCRVCNFKLESQEHVFTECPFMLRRLKNEQYLRISPSQISIKTSGRGRLWGPAPNTI